MEKGPRLHEKPVTFPFKGNQCCILVDTLGNDIQSRNAGAHACPPRENQVGDRHTPNLSSKRAQATDASGHSHNLVKKLGSPKPDKVEHPNQAKNTAIFR